MTDPTLQDKYNNFFTEACGKPHGFYAESHYRRGDIDVKPPYSKDHYDYYRPDDAIPEGRNQQEQQKIMAICYSHYEKVGVIKSIIDMMSEFGSEGISIIHEDDGPNKFYQEWSRSVNLEDRAERFLNWLFKSGNTVVRRKYGKINTTRIKQLKEKNPSVDYGNIPLGYVFYNPANIELMGDDLAAFSEEKKYGIKIAQSVLSKYIKTPSNDVEKEIFDKLPIEIKRAIEKKPTTKGYYLVEIPKDKIYVAHYKKDDHQIWAKPLIYGVLSDIQFNEKIKLAKLSSLDGFINVTRLWKLGDHTNNVMPTPEAGAKLANIIANNTGSGGVDIIWDSMISMEEFYPPIENLSNFSENTSAILLGMGIPESLVGSKDTTGKASTGSNSVSLKTLVKKLEAGRRELRKWLNAEIDIIQERMGFRTRPEIQFANADLFDEQVYFKMILDLVDRNILSEERVLQIVNEIPSIEKARIAKEEKMRKDGAKPNKASPYYNPQLENQQDHEIVKIKLTDKLQSKNDSNNSNTENESKRVLKEPRDRGRPPNSRDSIRRTRKTKAEQIALTYALYDKVSEISNQMYLKYYKLSNARQFTNEQKKEIEAAKIKILSQIENPESEIDLVKIKDNFNNTLYQNFINLLEDSLEKGLTNEERKAIITGVYIDLYFGV